MTITKKKKILLAGGLVLILIAIFLLIYRGSGANYYLTPAELKAKANNGLVGRVRLGGQIISESVGSNKAAGALIFNVGDEEGKNAIPVVYKGQPPDTFDPDAKVIVEGVIVNGTLEADNLLVRCPEKYIPEKLIVGGAGALKVEGLIYR